MNLSKLSKSVLFVVSSFYFLNSIQAKPVEPILQSNIIVLDTEQIVPLEVMLFKPELEIPLAGRIIYKGKDIADIEYQLFDKNGALVWNKLQNINEYKEFYDFEFKDVDLKGSFDLKIDVLNKYGDILGTMTKPIKFEDGDLFLDIKDLTILNKPDKLRVGFMFENDKSSRKVLPRVGIYTNDKYHRLVKEVKSEEVGLGQKQKKRFTLEIKKDFAPGLYLLEASVISSKGESVTGVLQSSFFRKGNYVKMKEYELLLDDYLDNKKIGLWFKGRILEYSDEGVKAIFELKDDNDEFLKESEIPLMIGDDGKFTDKFSFSLDKLLPKFSGVLKIKKGDKVIWEEVLQSPQFKLPEEIKPLSLKEEPIIIKKEKKKIPVYIYTLGIVVFAFFALLLVLHSAKKQTFIWLLFIGLGTLSIGNVFAEDIHTVYWSHPVSGWGFTQNSKAGDFSKMHIEGAIFDPLGKKDFFGDDGLSTGEMIIQFKDEDGKTQAYQLEEQKPDDGRTYAVDIDLTKDEFTDEKTGLSKLKGKLYVQLLFKKKGGEDLWYGTPAEKFNIILDSTPPELSPSDFNYSGTEPTKQPTEFKLTCEDEGIGCFDEDSTEINSASNFLSFQKYNIKGNFCTDTNKCDISGARGFEICDAIGNCTDAKDEKNELSITWYDPIPPELNELEIFDEVIGANFVSRRAFEKKDIKVEYKDPDKVDKDSYYASKFDDHACGDKDFFEFDGICKQKVIPCVINYSKRGKKTFDTDLNSYGECTGGCPTGYEVDGDYCVRKCSNERFYPTSMCFGYDSSGDGNGDSFCLDGGDCHPTP